MEESARLPIAFQHAQLAVNRLNDNSRTRICFEVLIFTVTPNTYISAGNYVSVVRILRHSCLMPPTSLSHGSELATQCIGSLYIIGRANNIPAPRRALHLAEEDLFSCAEN